jgi:zinc and cadmium transporter
MIPEIYAIISVIVVSLISVIGIVFLLMKKDKLNKLLLFLVSLSAGSLLGGVFLHLLPEITLKKGFTFSVSLLILMGVLIFFIIEWFVKWRHCHIPSSKNHPHHLAPINLIGDGIHNFIDGLIIAASYMIDIQLGIATTIIVIVHEVPQEIGDFGILIYSGLTRKKALFYNFLSALFAILGAIIGLVFNTQDFSYIILSVAAGGFLYIAGSDLIPEIQKKCTMKNSFTHLLGIILGIVLMILIKIVFE